MNILMVNKYYWRKGGSESVFFSESEMLEEAGHTVIPFSMKSEKNESTMYDKYFVSEVDYSDPGIVNRVSAAAKIIYSFEAKSKMDQLLDENEVDLAHLHIFQHQISPSVFTSLRSRNIPIILTLHDLKPICPNYKMYSNGRICEDCKGRKFSSCFKNKCTKGSRAGSLINTIEMYLHYLAGFYQSVDKYIAVSEFYKKKMIEFGFPKEKIDYLPNYVDVAQYPKLTEDKGYVLYAGRLSEEKGMPTLIKAATLLPNIPFYIVGSGPLELEFRSIIKERKMLNIHFTGFKTGKELRALQAGATCVVVPSEWYENCPMIVLEAFASSKLVIGTKVGGIPELIDEGIDGYVFELGNAVELAEKISFVWCNRDIAKEMGMRARIKVEEKYGRSLHYEGLTRIYNSVLKK